jgi:hypothetical protein
MAPVSLSLIHAMMTRDAYPGLGLRDSGFVSLFFDHRFGFTQPALSLYCLSLPMLTHITLSFGNAASDTLFCRI